MKQNRKQDEHIALGMIAAYAAGMIIAAFLFAMSGYAQTSSDIQPNVSQASSLY